jgi:low temperature requirement protein LtrA
MAAMFVVALTIPEAWEDLPGGVDGPLVLVSAYTLARIVHLAVYNAAALGDEGLRRQVAITFVPMLSGASLLVAGALIGGSSQTALFAAGLAVDWAGTYVTSKEGSWRIHSPRHWTERHGLFVILAIGESIVAIGVGAAQLPISIPLLAGAVLGVFVSVCLWWLYFDIVSLAAEEVLVEASETARVKIAIDAYTYLHFPLVAGIVLAALGVEEVLAHAEETRPLGAFAAAALAGGLALYLAGHLAFKRRMHGRLNVPRLLATAVLAAAVPVCAALPPLAALALVLGVLAVLVTSESAVHADKRRRLRGLET